MATKFERIFHRAKAIMLTEGLKAKDAIMKAIEQEEESTVRHPTAEEIGMMRDAFDRRKEL